jgi:hypothetical protein
MGNMKTTKSIKCWVCFKTHDVLVDKQDVVAFNREPYPLLEDVLHYLTADERELIRSGTCGPCYDKMFPDA